jgi:hypothetical protein
MPLLESKNLLRDVQPLAAFPSHLMKKIRSLYFEYIEKNTSAAREAFANACHRRNLDPETTAESFQ